MAATGPATAAAIRTAVLKNLLRGAQLTQVQQLQSRLITIVQRAIQNVNSGTATGAWAQRLAATPAISPLYRVTLGNTIHEEAFNLIQQEIAVGMLPAGLRMNVGRAIPGAGPANTYGRLRPDIRMPLGGGNEAVWDITTAGQAGHARPYTVFGFVQYVVELLY